MHTHNIFEYREPWESGVAASLMLHGVLVVGVVLAGYYSGGHGENWGGSVSGESMSATLVSSAIPLPSTPTEKPNVLATESKGLSQSEPVKETAPEPEAAPGQTTVSIYQPEEQTEAALAVGKDTELSGPKVHIVPLTAAKGDLLVAAADAGGPAVGLGLERKAQKPGAELHQRVPIPKELGRPSRAFGEHQEHPLVTQYRRRLATALY